MKGQLLHKVFHTLTEAFQNCLRRFPSTVCFVLALTAYLVYLVATDMDDDRKLVMVLGYYFLSVRCSHSLSTCGAKR